MMFIVVLLFSSLMLSVTVVAYLLFKGIIARFVCLAGCTGVRRIIYAVCRTRRPVACTSVEACTGERFVVQGNAIWTVCSTSSELSIQRLQQQTVAMAVEEQSHRCTGEMARLHKVFFKPVHLLVFMVELIYFYMIQSGLNMARQDIS